MATPCLYLDIDDTGISACLPPLVPPDRAVSIRYAALSDTEEKGSAFQRAMDMLAGDSVLGDHLDGCTHAVVTLAPDLVWFRHTSLPFKDKNKIKQVLPLELAQDLPDPAQDVLTDFHVLDPQFEKDLFLIFSATLAEEKMTQICDGLNAMGLAPAVVTARGLAQATAFLSGTPKDTDCLFVHLAPGETVLVLVIQGAPMMVRALKSAPYEAGQEEILAREIRSTLAGAWIRAGLNPEDFKGLAVFLSGEPAAGPKDPEGSDPESDYGPDLSDAWAARLGRALADQFSQAGPSAPEWIPQAPWQDLVTPESQPPGLLNFCVGAYRTDSFFTRFRTHLITSLILAALAFGLGLYDLHRQNAALEEKIHQVRQASETLYKKSFPKSGPLTMPPLLLMESKVKQARQALAGDNGTETGGDIRIMTILQELSGRIPKEIDLAVHRLVFNHGRVVLTGVTANFNDVDRIKGLIQGSPRVKTVSITSAEADKTGKQVRFKFILEL